MVKIHAKGSHGIWNNNIHKNQLKMYATYEKKIEYHKQMQNRSLEVKTEYHKSVNSSHINILFTTLQIKTQTGSRTI